MAATTVVTISRQFCSGGSEVGQAIAARLGFRYADRDVLRAAADALGAREDELSDREERLASFWESLAPPFPYAWPETAYIPPSTHLIADRDLFAVESKIIEDLAERENCVVVGRGGAYILRRHPRAIHVLLHASTEARIRRCMEIYHAEDRATAGSMLRASDRARERFFRHISGEDWMRATNYHLTLDTGLLGCTQAAELIAGFVRRVAAGDPSVMIERGAAGGAC